jgi:hypothetical protein
MKNFLQNALVPIFILIFSYQVNAQNAIIGSGFTNGWSVPGDLIYFNAGAGLSRVATLNPRAAGNQYFRLVRGWDGNNAQFGPAGFGCPDTDWTNPGVIYGMSACGGGAFFINCPNTTDNYVFKTPNGPTSVDLLYFRVQGAVRSVSSVTQLPTVANVTVGVPTTVTANLDGALATGQAVYLRYTSNNFANSVVVPMTGSGATYTATIPGAVNAMSANVRYYVFTSGTINVAPNGSNADLYTINLNNNGGPNYTYTVSNNVVTWNGTSWSNGVGPSAQAEAILTGAYNSGETEGVFTASKVTINTGGSLTIASNTNITVTNDVVNNLTEAAFVIENNGNLIQTNDVTNTGSATVLRMSAPMARLDYTLWSSPVAGQLLLDFSPLTLVTPTSRFYSFDPTLTASGGGSGAYVSITNPAATPFAEGNGYLIRASNLQPAVAAPWLGTFKGVPNNGNVSISSTSGSWYAIGNPYPSTIDADEFIAANGLTQPLYFWRKTNGASGTAYATYTSAGGAGTAPNVSGTIMTPDGVIAPGQGFLVQATSSSLNFTNSMRNGDDSTQFFRTNSVNRSRVWLNLSNTDGFKNQTLIAYMPSATNGVDEAIDGRFYENDIPTQLSSLINGEEFAVQGRAPFTVSDIVPLGFRVETTGNYSVAIDHVDGLFADGQEVFLKDNFTNTVHNLTNAPYNFVASTGTTNARFEIVFESNLATENPVLNENTVIIYKQNQDIVVNTGKIEMKNVQVYDIQGRLLVQQKDVNASTTKLSVGTTNQVLIVKVTSKDNSVVTKKVIN